MKKKALLDLLEELFPHYSRKNLFTEIMCGKVKIHGETIRDPKRKVPINCTPEIGIKRYVSRGGYKLEQVLKKEEGYLKSGEMPHDFSEFPDLRFHK